jgi:hypothetical protein
MQKIGAAPISGKLKSRRNNMSMETIFDRSGIKLEENNGTIYCYFPKQLKDEFCSSLPSAKWDASNFAWVVTTRVRKRVLAWAEHTVEAEEIENSSEKLEDEELEYIKEQMQSLLSGDKETREAELSNLVDLFGNGSYVQDVQLRKLVRTL